MPAATRVPTLVTAPKEAPPPKEERALMKQTAEELPTAPRQKPEQGFNVAWEMVVPKMVRSAPKTAAPQQISPSPAAEEPEKNEKNEAMAALIAGQPTKQSLLKDRRVLIGAVITIIGIVVLLAIHHWWPRPKQTSTPAPLTSPLKLEVQPENNGLMDVRWNPGSAVIAQSKEARLIIMERDLQPKVLTLSPDQLKSGHLPFQPLGDRVVFRLEVVDRSGAVTKESVLTQAASTPSAPPTPVPTQPVTKSQNTLAKAARNSDADDDADLGRASKSSEPQTSRTAVRPFTPPPAAPRNSKDGRLILPEPPSVSTSVSNSSPIHIPDPGERAGIAPPPANKQGAVTPLPGGGNLQPGKLIKKVAPVYPQMAAASRVQGVVRFTALIGKDGKVHNLQVLSGPSLLVAAATDAVKQWVYQPTTLNGAPVEVQTQINIDFTLAK